MSVVKSLSVGHGDMFYIRHGSDSFTMIDCCLSDDNRDRISTHPDEDHYGQIEYLDEKLAICNFYCVKNEATKENKTDSFKHYCKFRDGSQAYYVKKGCTRRWLNEDDSERGSAGIGILWPDTSNAEFQNALKQARNGVSFNNISLIAHYAAANGARMLWLGDLETAFMESIEDDVALPPVHVIFAPHHGRHSGKIPNSWLDKLKPKIIVLGEAPSRHLTYYGGYNTLTQNRAGDLTFDCGDANRIHVCASSDTYSADFLYDAGECKYSYYIGTLKI